MRFRKALYAAVFGVFVFLPAAIFAQEGGVTPTHGVEMKILQKPSGGYTASDLYILEKGTRRSLSLYARAVVMRPFSEVTKDRQKFDAFLREFGLTPASGVRVERITAALGTKDAKVAVKTKEYYVAYFQQDVKPALIMSLLAKMSAHENVWEAHPVFLVDDELVFPAGVWVTLKESARANDREYLYRQITKNGYAIPWDKVPAGVPARSLYFTPSTPGALNPLTLSRLAEEDLVVERAVADLVSIQPLVMAEQKISRPSGHFHDLFTVTYTLKHNARRVQVDVEKIKKWDSAELRPEGALNELFKFEAVRVKVEDVQVRQQPGTVTIDVLFRMYQPGDFQFSPPHIFYTIKGAAKEVIPLELEFAKTNFRVVGLVPRDDQGNMLLDDIQDWKSLPVPALDIPAMPQPPSYERTDIRYYMAGFVASYGGIVKGMRISGGILAGIGIFGFATLALLKTGRALADRRKKVAAMNEFYRTGTEVSATLAEGAVGPELRSKFVRDAHAALRDVLGFSAGVSPREMRSKVSPEVRPVLERALEAIDRVSAAAALTRDNADALESSLDAVRRARRSELRAAFFSDLIRSLRSKVMRT